MNTCVLMHQVQAQYIAHTITSSNCSVAEDLNRRLIRLRLNTAMAQGRRIVTLMHSNTSLAHRERCGEHVGWRKMQIRLDYVRTWGSRYSRQIIHPQLSRCCLLWLSRGVLVRYNASLLSFHKLALSRTIAPACPFFAPQSPLCTKQAAR